MRFRLFSGTQPVRIVLFRRSAFLTHAICALCDHTDARQYARDTHIGTQEVRNFSHAV